MTGLWRLRGCDKVSAAGDLLQIILGNAELLRLFWQVEISGSFIKESSAFLFIYRYRK